MTIHAGIPEIPESIEQEDRMTITGKVASMSMTHYSDTGNYVTFTIKDGYTTVTISMACKELPYKLGDTVSVDIR